MRNEKNKMGIDVHRNRNFSEPGTQTRRASFDEVDTNVVVGGGGGRTAVGYSNGTTKSSQNNSNNIINKKRGRLRHESTDTDASDSLSATLERHAPDGGWGWVVVAAAFLVNMIADGVTFSFGVFYVELNKYFGESKSKTAWIGSLLASMPLLSGPIASSLADRFGCRRVTIAGSLLATIGFVLSSYANSVEMLFLTFGVITGFGLSLCYVAAVVIVAYYFEQRRSLATGLSVCGGGIGTFIFAPLTAELMNIYGWRGTTLLLAGGFLNLSICGALMRDLEWTKKKVYKTPTPCVDLVPPEINTMGFKKERLCNSAICIPTFVQEHEEQQNFLERNSNIRTCGNFPSLHTYSYNYNNASHNNNNKMTDGVRFLYQNEKNINCDFKLNNNNDSKNNNKSSEGISESESYPDVTQNTDSMDNTCLTSSTRVPVTTINNNGDLMMRNHSNNTTTTTINDSSENSESESHTINPDNNINLLCNNGVINNNNASSIHIKSDGILDSGEDDVNSAIADTFVPHTLNNDGLHEPLMMTDEPTIASINNNNYNMHNGYSRGPNRHNNSTTDVLVNNNLTKQQMPLNQSPDNMQNFFIGNAW